MSKKDLKELRKVIGVSSGSKRTVFLLTGLTALLILGIGIFAVLLTADGGTDKNFTPHNRGFRGLLPVGSQAPNFTAKTTDGGNVSLEDTGAERATMLVFFASWCPHCNKEAPIINELEGEYEDLRVIMAGIDGRDDSEKVRDFAQRYAIEGPAIYAPSLGRTYRVSGYPTIYILDESGEIVAAHSGEAPKGVLAGWIEEALDSSSG